MSYLEIRGLRKAYGPKVVLDGIDLDIEEGEFVSLLGPSGCGKTTVLRLIAGFEQPDAGTIAIGGESLEGVPSHQRNIGVVFQHFALFPHMTARQNIAFGLEQQKLPRPEIEQRVTEAMQTVQLGEFGDRRPRRLSGGQQQRVALARALVTRPRVILLDESLGALDKKLRTRMQIELRQIQQEVGITTIFVTHDQEEALTMSDRIAVMGGGVIAQFDTPEAIYRRPVSSYVAQVVGDINLVPGRLRDDSTAAVGGTVLPVPAAVAAPSGAVELGLRPQDVRVLTTAPAGPGPEVPGVLTYATFAGEYVLMGVRALGTEIKAQAPAGPAVSGLRPGDQVWLTWQPDALHVFAAEPVGAPVV